MGELDHLRQIQDSLSDRQVEIHKQFAALAREETDLIIQRADIIERIGEIMIAKSVEQYDLREDVERGWTNGG